MSAFRPLLRAWLALALVMGCIWLPARADDPKVQRMGQTFVANLPSGWQSQQGEWDFLEVADCYEGGQTCFGNNPSSPYGYPLFKRVPRFLLGASEAVVVFMRTPPKMRYYGFTQYLISRGVGVEPVLASLSDTLNLQRFRTLRSSAPGQFLFDQHAVLVWTADMNTHATVLQVLAQQGIDAAKVNFLPIPVQLPLHMGYSADADSFAVLMRSALPEVSADFEAYRQQNPFYVVKVTPDKPPALSPAPMLGYADEASGVVEDPAYGAALDALVADIKAHYQDRFTMQDQRISLFTAKGLNCIAGTDHFCILDNHDALYSGDLTATQLTVQHLKDVVIVAGVNHRKTGKARYHNHTVNDPLKSTGIVSVDDTNLTTRSALYHAGVRAFNDPRRLQYQGLYAYAISYDCDGARFCLSIPAPTPDDPVGLEPGAAFALWSRLYVDPHTGVRPHEDEVTRQQVLVGTWRGQGKAR